MALVKNSVVFSIFNFKRKIGQENVFDDTLERKEAS